MSFSFDAVGTAKEVAGQLAAVDTYGNKVGSEAAALIAAQLGDPENTPVLGSRGEYRYVVKAWGHSGGGSPVSLHVEVDSLWVSSVAPETAPEDTRQGEVLAVIDKCISDLGFAAPETHAERLAAMRSRVEAAFAAADDED